MVDDTGAGAVADGFAATGVIGAAAFQPPKSSSAATFGAPWIPPPPVLRPEAEDEMPPHVEKSLFVAIGADLSTLLAFLVALLEVAGVAQASLEAQGSAVEKLENEVVLVAGGAGF